MVDTYGMCDAAKRMFGHVRQRHFGRRRYGRRYIGRHFKWQFKREVERYIQQIVRITRKFGHGWLQCGRHRYRYARHHQPDAKQLARTNHQSQYGSVRADSHIAAKARQILPRLLLCRQACVTLYAFAI